MNTPLCHQTANNSSNFSLNLRKQAMLTVPDASKVRIGVTNGSVWITLDHDSQDYVLEACGVFTTSQPRRAIVYALQPSSITVAAVTSTSQRLDAYGLTLDITPRMAPV